VRLIFVARSSGPPASQPVSCLTCLSAYLLSFGWGCLDNTVVVHECSIQYRFTQSENVSVYSRGASVYCSHLLENRIDKVMSTAIPGEVWRSTSAEQGLHLGHVEETGNQGDFIGRADRRSSENVRGNDLKMWRTDYWRLPRSHCADFYRNQGCPEARANVLRKKQSFKHTVSPWSTN
jgi:hypothetical protein